MFGSPDEKNTPPAAAENPEKKSLFGWLRKKPQDEPAAVQAASETPTPPDGTVVQATIAPEVAAKVTVEVAPGLPEVVPAPPVDAPVVQAEPISQPAAGQPLAEALSVEPPQDMPQALPATAEAPRPSFSRFRINAGAEPVVVAPLPPAEPPQPEAAPVQQEQAKPGDNQGGWFARLKEGLAKTSASLGEGMASLFLGKKAIDDDLLDELETRLLTADVGVEATTAIVQNLTRRVARKELADSEALYKALQEELAALLAPVEQPLNIEAAQQPYVILVVGVNGVGKTTTIGKLARKLQQDGKKVMLAAGDTFRAAAVEQLQVWGERNQIAVVAQHTGADSASVIFDALQAAKARGMDVLIADTAGRLHTKDNLMEELKKVRRVIGKLDESAPHETLLVLDAGTGQNAINQTRQFHQAVNLSGLALTKLDGTAKGGVIFALAKQFGLPIRYIGVGEGIDDLRSFVAKDFVQALFADKQH